MEKYFGNAYRGDPGVPHSGPDRFSNIWIGCAIFSALTWNNPYMWTLSNQYKVAFGCKDDPVKHLLIGGHQNGEFYHWDGMARIYTYFLQEICVPGERALKIEMAIDLVPLIPKRWHDKAMLFEQYHWKKAREKNQPYKFQWNQMPFEVRQSYYFNWPVYFP